MNERPDPDGSFFERVWAVVAQIPAGRVTTYGDIAAHLGRRGAARIVGWALKDAVGSDLPCHRVVNRDGVLTGRRHFETPRVMAERLRSEGVTFVAGTQVDLDAHRWRPGGRSGPVAADGLASDRGRGEGIGERASMRTDGAC